jgi:hypothetical protein
MVYRAIEIASFHNVIVLSFFSSTGGRIKQLFNHPATLRIYHRTHQTIAARRPPQSAALCMQHIVSIAY